MQWNNASIYAIMLLLLSFVNAEITENEYESVKKSVEAANAHKGNIDAVNMPTRCEACQIFARDFEAAAIKIPLKLVSASFWFVFV